MAKKFDIITPHNIPKLVTDLHRTVHTFVWHCSATPEGKEVTPQEVGLWHKQRGFAEIGYNIGINLDGSIILGRDWDKIPAHVAGFNTGTLGGYYVGGLDKSGKPKDTRTPEQIVSMLAISEVLKDSFLLIKNKIIDFKGHRDFSPDKNGNGKIEPWEWVKACPCFDVKTEISDKL
jgi:N-acetylmuramoyl-L-alanine amidase